MHYTPNVDFAFNSLEHIMRDVNNGWLIRYTHANVASFFFIFVYAHIGRGLYYSSYKSPRVLVWSIGVIILVLMMAIAFLGYLYSPKWFKFKNKNLSKQTLNENSTPESNNGIVPQKIFGLHIFRAEKYFHSVAKPSPFWQKYLLPKWTALLRGGGITSSLMARRYTTSIPVTLAPEGATFAFAKTKAKGARARDQREITRSISTSKEISLSTLRDLKGNYEDEVTKFLKEKKLVSPIFIYDNLSDSTVKNRVLNDTRGLSGIYLILNKFTLDYYIGSASIGKFYARFTNHLFNFNGSKVVKNAVKLYGISSFAFIVLELYPEIVNKENNKKLLDLEDFYLKSLLPNYNILTEAGSSFGYKHTEITRINMKANYSEERRRAIGNLNKGKNFSPSTIDLMRQAALNRTKPVYSLEGLNNMNLCPKGPRLPRGNFSKAIIVYNLDDTVNAEYSSIVEAAKNLGCDQKTIRRALKNPKGLLRRRWIVKLK